MHATSENTSGFIDAHVHLMGEEGIEAIRAAGIVGIRNAGMKMSGQIRRDSGCFRTRTPVVVSSCWALYKKGGYGALFGVPVDTRSEIKTEIVRLKDAGADIIKVMASGIVSLRQPGSVTAGGFDEEELRFIVEEAAALGLPVMAHANGESAVLAAAGAGVRSIEHGFFMTGRALDVMATKRTYWTPTCGALFRATERTGSTDAKKFILELIAAHLKMLNQAYRTGVPLAVGTDCVLPDPQYDASYTAELSYFQQAGICREEVAKIASEGGARLLGLLQ